LCQNQDWCGETKNLLKDADAFFKKEMKGKDNALFYIKNKSISY
jgi:hypothetical protein